jgi:hypothetical protein
MKQLLFGALALLLVGCGSSREKADPGKPSTGKDPDPAPCVRLGPTAKAPDAEANAFTDYFPELGGAGASAGLLNQAIELPLSELEAGDNRIELRSAHTWTGTYRVTATGADLVLDTP